LWKKTPGANNNRPHRRRRQGSLRRIRNTRTNSNASNNNNKKEEEIPEPTATIESRPSSISKEENSSVTEDDVSECDSDSSATNKGSTPSGEFGVGEDSPSRMRTRNKQTKEQLANKRAKRGTDTPDAAQQQQQLTTDSSKTTPNKADSSSNKRKNSKTETPNKSKKRVNDLEIDVGGGVGGSDDSKDNGADMKRKRSDSPTESLTTDSRPGSVLDEAESNSEPSDGNPAKETEEKDPLSLPSAETPLSVDDNESKDKIPEIKDEPQLPTTITFTSITQEAEETEESLSTVAAIETKIETDDIPSSAKETNELSINEEDKVSPTELLLSSPAATTPTLTTNQSDLIKEQEMLTKLANMKQEIYPVGVAVNAASATSPTAEFTPKEMIYIKKEPGDEDSIGNTNSNEPHDLKLKVEIKTELKSVNENTQESIGVVNEQPNNSIKYDADNSKLNYECNVKFNPSEVVKYGTDMNLKFPGGPLSEINSPIKSQHGPENSNALNMKYPPPPPDGGKYNQEGQLEYDMKAFIEQGGNKFSSSSPYLEPGGGSLGPGGPMKVENIPPVGEMKHYLQEPNNSGGTMKYQPPDEHLKYAPSVVDHSSSTVGKSYQSAYHPLAEQQQQQSMLRHPYDNMKFDQLMKYGLPPSSAAAQQAHDMKYITPEQQQQMGMMKYSSG
jgi:arginine-glutamic acid dipeptide repeats protein